MLTTEQLCFWFWDFYCVRHGKKYINKNNVRRQLNEIQTKLFFLKNEVITKLCFLLTYVRTISVKNIKIFSSILECGPNTVNFFISPFS